MSGISHDHSKILRKVWTHKEMIKTIFILGESQIAYASGGKVHNDIPKALEYGSFTKSKSGYELKFLWQHSRTAWGVDYKYLENLFKNNISELGENVVIVSEFGGMDAALGQYQKHNNMEPVITKYFYETLKFCTDYKTKLIFMSPWWLVKDDDLYKTWDDITLLLRKLSAENGLPHPIEVMHNVIERVYPTVDQWHHHTPEDSERIVDYVISKVDESFSS
jgi:hypothetical protein